MASFSHSSGWLMLEDSRWTPVGIIIKNNDNDNDNDNNNDKDNRAKSAGKSDFSRVARELAVT